MELGYGLKIGEREGNYRVYATLDGSLPSFDDEGNIESDKVLQKNAFGYGVSIDQQITEKLAVFARYGRHDDKAYTTVAAWSAGLQYTGLIPDRGDDVLGLAYGQVQANGVTGQEKLAEFYYRVKVNDQIGISPHVQYLVNPAGDSSRDDIVVAGLRTQITF